MSIGDSLSRKIDEGLANSRYGIVVLSPAFFNKPWAKRELQGLTAREMAEKTDLILPIWHRISLKEVLAFSPPLADKKAVSSNDGINTVLREISKKLRPEESPLIVARDNLVSLGFDPPPISDEWWLDVVEFKEFFKFPDLNIHRRWICPLPYIKEDWGRDRGLNIASTALQIDWSFDGQELNIGPTTPPDEVHRFIRNWPGLYDCARDNAAILALYVPQITIPGFDLGFEDVFDELMTPGNKEADIIFSYGRHETVDGKEPLCGDVISLRHPYFGNYTEVELGHWYFDAHDTSYLRSTLDIWEGLVWLVSKDADWLPQRYRDVFVKGILARNEWVSAWGWSKKNEFREGLFDKSRSKFRLTKGRKDGLLQLVKEAKKSAGINDNSEAIMQRLLDLDLPQRHYDYQDWLNERRSAKD